MQEQPPPSLATFACMLRRLLDIITENNNLRPSMERVGNCGATKAKIGNMVGVVSSSMATYA